MRFFVALCIAFIAAFGPVIAQEYIESNGRLADEDFYRMVACAAPLGGACQKPFVRWSDRKAQDLTVSLYRNDPAFPAELRASIEDGLNSALLELNKVPNGPRFRRVANGSRADIRVLLMDIAANSRLKGTQINGLDGVQIQHAWVQIWWNKNRNITRSAIVFSRDVTLAGAGSIMLEELTQSLGFITDLRNTYYDKTSIFSEDSNALNTLGTQDLMAIQRHYGRK
ncbi:DUF2927 domain-containing protein [Algirhabdus cladophorae]|uniref:DUF2927 domain-containing protein n=1 Tax=Algirhabdus cladophorae TaxID=3377108 RepID=UPI003B846963